MSNPVRTCIGCAKTDDHPRHVVTFPDGSEAGFHMDCHVITSACEVCKAQLAEVGGIEGNPKGEQLRKHLMGTGPGADQRGWTAPGDEPRALAKSEKD